MNTKHGFMALVVACAFFTTAACSGETPQAQAPATVTVTPSSSAPAPPAEPDAKMVAWLDGICGAVHGHRQAVNDYLSKQPSSEVVTRGSLSEDLGIRAGLAGKAVDELNALPASPIPGGDAAKKSFVDQFTSARDAAAEGKRKVDASKGQNALNDGVKALEAAQKVITDAADPLASFTDLKTPGLGMALGAAKKCQPSS